MSAIVGEMCGGSIYRLIQVMTDPLQAVWNKHPAGEMDDDKGRRFVSVYRSKDEYHKVYVAFDSVRSDGSGVVFCNYFDLRERFANFEELCQEMLKVLDCPTMRKTCGPYEEPIFQFRREPRF